MDDEILELIDEEIEELVEIEGEEETLLLIEDEILLESDKETDDEGLILLEIDDEREELIEEEGLELIDVDGEADEDGELEIEDDGEEEILELIDEEIELEMLDTAAGAKETMCQYVSPPTLTVKLRDCEPVPTVPLLSAITPTLVKTFCLIVVLAPAPIPETLLLERTFAHSQQLEATTVVVAEKSPSISVPEAFESGNPDWETPEYEAFINPISPLSEREATISPVVGANL